MLDQQGTKRSLLAVASLASALLVFFPPAWFAAIVLGIVALVEIKQSDGRFRGRGLAITGIVLSVVWTIALVWLVASALMASREDALSGAAPGPDEYQESTTADFEEPAEEPNAQQPGLTPAAPAAAPATGTTAPAKQ